MIKIVWLLHQDYTTQRCQFSIDSEDDLELLPKYGIAGKEKLNTISSCCPGSRAICSDGSVYALNGNDNEWIMCAASSGGSGGGSSELPADLNFATDSDIRKLFK